MKWIAGIFLLWISSHFCFAQNTSFDITKNTTGVITSTTFENQISAGDTIFIDSSRTKSILFENLEGAKDAPITVINKNGVVKINDQNAWAAIQFKNCRYIKFTGNGNPNQKYGFELSANSVGLGVTELSSDFEISHIKIVSDCFAGIQVKKDYHRNPPIPIPQFNYLVIHSCFISNVEEGMYLGETVSPGMTFSHVRIFNNIVFNTLRDGIQLANMVDDVEVYNNLILQNGRGHLASHGNCIQIGDNTIGSFHHNILLDATEYGIIVFGSGDINIFENYLADNRGIFSDDRSITIANSDIKINKNYFRDVTGEVAITLFNSKNNFKITENQWFSADNFVTLKANENIKVEEQNNVYRYLDPLYIENFKLKPNGPQDYLTLGPQVSNAFIFNYKPLIESLTKRVFNWNTNNKIPIFASTADSDKITFEFQDSLDFTFFTDFGNGSAEIQINPKEKNKGIYKVTIVAWDHSHNQKSREIFEFAVRNPNNNNPRITNFNELVFGNLRKETSLIQVSDADMDETSVINLNFPDFIKVIKTDNEYIIECKAKFLDVGRYDSLLLIADDGFGMPDSNYFNLIVQQTELEEGTVMYRVNCGGPEVNDTNLNWEDSFNKELVYQKTKMHNTGSHSWSGTNLTGKPDNLFGPYCYSNSNNENMHWEFSCPNGKYKVNLLFAERQSDINDLGASVFNVHINDSSVLENYNIYETGGLEAQQKSFEINVSSKKIKIDFEPIQNNPKINGIEIVFIEYGNNPPLASEMFELNPPGLKLKSTLYPNPVSTKLFIKTTNNTEFSKIEILNIQGKIIQEEQFNTGIKTQEIELINKKSGIYFVRLISNKINSETHKIIISNSF